jgi:acyl carrier protein
MSAAVNPDARAIEGWLRERLAAVLATDPARVDFARNADSLGLDSVAVVEVCADLGRWLHGRELAPDALWAASSLGALCRQLAGEADTASAAAAPPTASEPAGLGAALQVVDAGRWLRSLARHTRIVAAGDRWTVATLDGPADLVSVAYRHVDEATGEARGSTYHGGKLLESVRAWVSEPGGARQRELCVYNGSDRALALTVAAWACTEGGAA